MKPCTQDPVAWTLYGLVVSNVGKEDDKHLTTYNGEVETVPEFIHDTFRYRHGLWSSCCLLLGVIAAALCGKQQQEPPCAQASVVGLRRAHPVRVCGCVLGRRRPGLQKVRILLDLLWQQFQACSGSVF